MAGLCPWKKVPICCELILRVDTPVIIVGSLQYAVSDPPPDTLTLLIWGEAAAVPTLTVAVSGG
jgi:hypothetical protein